MSLAAENTVAVLLAAGLSRRFGPEDKLLAEYRGVPLALHAARLVTGLPFAAKVAVCRPGSGATSLLREQGFEVEENRQSERGMGTSLALAARWAEARDVTAIAVFLADMPEVTGAHVDALLTAYTAENDVVFSFNGETRLPPALIGRRHFPALASLQGDHGARDLVRRATVVEASVAELRDVDRLEQIEP